MSGGIPNGLGIGVSALGGGGSSGIIFPGGTISVAHMHAQHQAMLMQAAASQPSRALKPDPRQPDTLGWREWLWSGECLQSPSQGTLWPSSEHAALHWIEADVVRGVQGIHALLVPKHWKILHELGVRPLDGHGGETVTGIVERFGRYVMGTKGWRAEQVVIRELLAPSTAIGLKLEQLYPDVIVHYPDQLEEGDLSCKSEKSSALEKGSRSLLPSMPTPSPAPPPSQPSPALAQAHHQAMIQQWQALQNAQLQNQPLQSASVKTPPPEMPLAQRQLATARSMRTLSFLWLGVSLAWCALMAVRFLA